MRISYILTVLNPKSPRSTPTSPSQFGLFIYSWARCYPLEHVWFTRGYTLKENWLPSPGVINCLQLFLSVGVCEPLLPPCWNVDWLDLIWVLCRQLWCRELMSVLVLLCLGDSFAQVFTGLWILQPLCALLNHGSLGLFVYLVDMCTLFG